MKRKLLSRGFLLIIAACVLSGDPSTAKTGKEAGKKAASTDDGALITVMNPAIAGKMSERFPLTPRLDSLEGKTIYLIDIQWGGPEAAYSVYEEMKAWFAKNIPSVKIVLRRTTDNMFADDPGLRKELIEKKADAALVGIAG